MKKLIASLVAGLAAGAWIMSGYTISVAQEKDATPSVRQSKPAATEKSATKASEKNDNTTSSAASGVSERMSADEEAIRRSGVEFVKAYEAGDAKALAALFATDAECVHESGVCCSGSAAIAESLTGFFSDNPGCKLMKHIESVRFVSPGVAIEDGTSLCTCADESSAVECNYTTVHVKQDGKWLVASIHDRDARDFKQHSLQLGHLAWLQGDWIDEERDAVVRFSCNPVDDGNFLLRSFSIQIEGQEMMTGTQRIGWDPLTRKLRTWIFDSSGSFGEGAWYRESDDDTAVANDESENGADENTNRPERWMLKLTGVLADGKSSSSTSVYTLINDHTMTWQSIDHEIAGVHQPDSDILTIVRTAAEPDATAAAEDK